MRSKARMPTHLHRLQLLLVLSCLASAAAAAAAPEMELQLPVFRLADLQAPDAGALARLRAAVYDVGMFAVTEADDLTGSTSQQPAAVAALGSLVRCTHALDTRHHLDAALRQVRLPDGSRRRTLATETNGGQPRPIPQEAEGSRCPGFEPEAARLRSSVDRTGRAYAAALDSIVHGQQQPSADVDSFGVAVRDGESLEHFHMFERPTTRSGDSDSGPDAPTPALDMHSDIGLFIIMTPAQYFQQTASNASNADASSWQYLAAHQPRPQPGLLLQLPSGRVVRPLFPDASLLVMSGEGGSRWMRVRAGAAAPPAAAHEVILPEHMQGMVRSWYGRMYFPLRDARLQPDASDPPSDAPGPDSGSDAAAAPLTFQQYREQTMAAFVGGQPLLASTAGCSPGRKILQDSGACPDGELYCWMQCMTIPSGLPCSKDTLQCSNPAGQLWPTDFPGGDSSHCMDCTLTCPAAPPPAPPAAPPRTYDGFCNTQLTAITMWMTGFQWSGLGSAPCVALLFREWVLDSRLKFGFACVGVFLMGVAVAALGVGRSAVLRVAAAEALSRDRAVAGFKAGVDMGAPCPCGPPAPGPPPLHVRLQRAGWLGVEALCYAVQITLAYFLMLIAMTYEAELFIMVVLGLTAGHALFGVSLSHAVQERENPEPCCA